MSFIFISSATNDRAIRRHDVNPLKLVRRDVEAPQRLSAAIQEFSPDLDAGPAKLLDPRALRREKQAETAFLTQQIAQDLGLDSVIKSDEEEGSAYNSKAVKACLDYMAKTPEERAFDAFLKSKGLTQERFDSLPAEEKRALIEEFEEVVRLQVEQKASDRIAGEKDIVPL